MRVALASFVPRVALLVAAASCRPPLPPTIEDELVQTPKGEATVVFFTDFQCPFCRRTHAALAPLIREHGGKVRLVLRHVPLPRHPDALTAARAAVCVESLSPDLPGYVHRLMTSDDLSAPACERLAVEHGVDRERYRRCLRDPSTDRRIKRDIASFDAVGGDGVPLLYVGRERLDGVQTRRTLDAALESAD